MKKSILFVTLLFILFALSPVYSQAKIFDEYLMPSDPELLKEFNKIDKVDKNLESIINELRIKAQEYDCPKELKKDLAAFLLLKVIIQRDLPYENNEGLLFEVSDLIPEDYYLELTWGDLLLYSKDFEQCIRHYESALNKRQDNIELTAKCGLAYLNVLNYEKALEYINVYLEKNPKDIFYLYLASRCEFELNNYDETVVLCERALEEIGEGGNPYKESLLELLRKAKEAAASTSDSTQDEDQRFVITFAGNSRDDLGDVTFEMLNDIYYDVTSLLNYDPDVKINVIFFLTDDYYKRGKDWSAASTCGLQIMVPLKSGYKDETYVKGLLAHEFTHAIINLKTSNRAPIWVHEGLAQYLEYSTAYGSPEVLRPDYENILQNDFLENGLFIPLNKVQAYIGGKDRKDVSRGYVASYLAMRCMADFYGEQSFDTLLSSLGKGKTIQEAVKEATGNEYSDFQDDLKDWIKNQ